jgi:O-methyltransferase
MPEEHRSFATVEDDSVRHEVMNIYGSYTGEVIEELLGKYPLISDQVNREQVQVILSELARVIDSGVDGGIVEFGCYIGTTSVFIQRLLDQLSDDREFHVYDSFEGLPPKAAQDSSPAGTQFQAGELSVSKKDFLREFHKAGLRPPKVHKAWFSDLSAADVPEQIAFAFLDGDFYESIRDSLILVLSRMQPGGTIIIDDYAREALPGVAKAVQELLPAYLRENLTTSYNLAIIRT